MESAIRKDSWVASSPFSSPNIGALLKIKIISWSQETGLPVSVHVQVGHKTFNLHKYPLFSKSGYFKKRLNESNELELPEDFPGGPDTFEMIVLFLYGSTTLIDPFNVAALRCAAEYLEMTEEHCPGSLCERFDLYLNQVVLQSWDDTLIVLQRCQTLLPWSEELLIVSRCIESLAFMACMEILDPERRRDQPVVTLEALANQPWSSENVKEIVSQDLWIKDLIALPFGFFKRIIGSLRRQGMKEKYLSPIIVFYANKWLLSKKTCQLWKNSREKTGDFDTNGDVLVILEGTLDLLPMGERASRVIPVGFYIAMLSRLLDFGLASDRKIKLQDQIAYWLHFSRAEDFLLPGNGIESFSSSLDLATMEIIFSTYVSFNMDKVRTPATYSIVAELWDTYLSHIAPDPNLEPKRFMELIETIPISYRHCHDQLYRAMNTFIQAHKDISQEDKGLVCSFCSTAEHTPSFQRMLRLIQVYTLRRILWKSTELKVSKFQKPNSGGESTYRSRGARQ
ncbi:BTB domain-containing protein/NPH3 domain-containing protein [Cephalotus follicularis]|uniref:BTB domain-containing protein/NPH3 domain-containing protein n=1 Tax=Cephalotus follicularis TaxID=3775 RepID=A0A1Q3C365_CEPFO|nr:BTB domain-containing protein/NPH3 domain-containing protein [Cephalotus follicularis]